MLQESAICGLFRPYNSIGMSDRPLLSTDNSPHYGASDRSSDSPELSEYDEQNRQTVEKRLLRKLDLRFAFLVLMYIMSCVSWCF